MTFIVSLKMECASREKLSRLVFSTQIKKIIASVLIITTAAIAVADESPFSKAPPYTQRAFINNINLSAKDFFIAYTSKLVADRRFAEIYLLGVLDASEGVSWCDYHKYKTISIDEEIYARFKRLPESKLNMRASSVIMEILGKAFPCEGATK